MRVFPLLSMLLISLSTFTAAADPTPIAVSVPQRKEPVSYANEVADILAAKCVGCHSAALAENKLNLEEVPLMLKGGKRGPAIVSGKAEKSLLFQMAAHLVDPVMPPKDKKDAKPLTPEELGLIKLWIDAGAKDDSDVNGEPATPVQLGELPPGVQPINAVDMNSEGTRLACGRANVVQVYDVDSGLEIISLGGHKDLIQSLRFSPDGRRLAAGSYQIVTLWNMPTGAVAATMSGSNDQVRTVVPLPDGKTVVSGGNDSRVRFWNRQDGKAVRDFGTPAQVFAIAVSKDAKMLAVAGSDNIVRILKSDDGKEVVTLKGHGGPVNDVAFLPGDSRVASVSNDGTCRIWTLPEKEGEMPAEPVVLTGEKGPLRSLAITPDGAQVLIGGDGGEVQTWSVEEGKRTGRIENLGAMVLALAVNPKGDQLLIGLADKTARLFELTDLRPKATLGGHLGPVNSVAFSPDGSRLVTAGGEGGIKIWETATGQGVIAFGHTAPNNQAIQPVQKVAFLGDGELITASADKTLKTWTFEGAWSEMKPLGPHVFRVLAIDFSPDGTLLAAGGGEPSRSGEIQLWEVGKGLHVRTLDSLHSDTVFGLRFSPDGTLLASSGADKFMKVTRVAGGKEFKSFEGHTHHVLAVDWKADGKQIATGGADNVIKVWDLESGEQVRTFQPAGKQVTAVRWLPGKSDVAGASGDKSVKFWNADNGNVNRTFGGSSDYVFGVAVSKDGSRVAAGGADSVLFVWNGQNGQTIRKLEPPPSAVAKPAEAEKAK